MSTVLVTGASGFVGSNVVPALITAGHRVRALVRDDAAQKQVEARLAPAERQSLEFARGDVTQQESLPTAVVGVDAVVHLVAIARDFTKGRDLQRLNAKGTQNVVAAMQAAAIRRLVHLGGLGLSDDPKLKFASSKARGIEAVKASGLDWTVLNPSVMWGPRDGFLNLIAGPARLPLPIVALAGGGTTRFQPLWIGDLARIVPLVLERPESVGRTYDLGGPRYWTQKEITQEVVRGLGKRRLILPLPVPLVRLVAGAAELVHAPFPVATDQLRQLSLDNITSLTSVRDAFGFDPRPMDGNLGYLRQRPSRQ